MNQKYQCDPCNYVTDRFSNFNRHKKTKKHINNIAPFQQPKFGSDPPIHGSKKNAENTICQYCNKPISYKNHIKHHYNTSMKYIKDQIKK